MQEEKLKTLETDFWTYAGNCRKCASIEDVFCEWAKHNNLTVDEFKHSYAAIETTLEKFFNKKTAKGWEFKPDGSLKFDDGGSSLPTESPSVQNQASPIAPTPTQTPSSISTQDVATQGPEINNTQNSVPQMPEQTMSAPAPPSTPPTQPNQPNLGLLGLLTEQAPIS